MNHLVRANDGLFSRRRHPDRITVDKRAHRLRVARIVGGVERRSNLVDGRLIGARGHCGAGPKRTVPRISKTTA